MPDMPVSPAEDLLIFSEQHLLRQMETAPVHLGYRLVRFYADERGLPAKEQTDTVETFYLSPSGGTLRDKDLNIVLYSARYDVYKGLGKTK